MCGLTDLELSGAAQLPTREAERRRPTRPLERLVMSAGHECLPPNEPTLSWRLRQRPRPRAALRSQVNSNWRKRATSADCLKTRSLFPRPDARGCPSWNRARMREPRCDSHRHLPGDITDLELSGAAQLLPGAAGCRRRTRPLERLVRFQAHTVAEANTTPTERRCSSKLELHAKDRSSEVNAGGPRSPYRVRTPGTMRRARTVAGGTEPRAMTKPPVLDAKRKETLRRRERCPEN